MILCCHLGRGGEICGRAGKACWRSGKLRQRLFAPAPEEVLRWRHGAPKGQKTDLLPAFADNEDTVMESDRPASTGCLAGPEARETTPDPRLTVPSHGTPTKRPHVACCQRPAVDGVAATKPRRAANDRRSTPV